MKRWITSLAARRGRVLPSGRASAVRRFAVPAGRLAAASVLVAACAAPAPASSLLFHGNGVAAPDLDRVKIQIDDVANSLPGPPADAGATDMTIEFWMKASAADNTASPVGCGDFAWNPVATEKPVPYCKLSPSPAGFTKLQCRTD